MSYYDPYYSTPRSRRPSLNYPSTPMSAYEPLAHSYSQPAYSMYGSTAGHPYVARTSYDDIDLHDPYYSDRHSPLNSYPPVVQPLALTRPRRSSSVSYTSSPYGSSPYGSSPYGASSYGSSSYADPLRRGFGRVIKFKRKGAFRPGITIGEAQANVRLSGSDSYTLQDLGVDLRGKIFVNLRWPGYPPLNYEIPIDGYTGYVDIQSLARRVGRAVSHYLQANVIPIRWDHIEMQYLEELSVGMWHLKMSAQ